jgi:hypothetical protein
MTIPAVKSSHEYSDLHGGQAENWVTLLGLGCKEVSDETQFG